MEDDFQDELEDSEMDLDDEENRDDIFNDNDYDEEPDELNFDHI